MTSVGISGGNADLPEIIPIFPLPGVLLLPRGELPLHIFEPRYRAMTAAAMGGDGVIAMIQPSGEGDGVNPPVFPVGCLGRITDARQTEDGRYYLTLIGLSRFRIREELPLLDGYRRVIADYGGFPGDLVEKPQAGVERETLISTLKEFVGAKGLAADWSALDRLGSEALVNALAMICPFSPTEKQALLEAPDVEERGRLLTALLEMAARAPGGNPALRH